MSQLSRRGFLGAGAAAAVVPVLPWPELRPATAAAVVDNTVLWQPVEGSSIWFVNWGKETIKLWEGMNL